MKRLGRVAPYLALLLFTLLAFRAILFTSDSFIPWDLPFYHVPQAIFASESLRNGQLPLWDPNTYCGRPMYAQIQPAYFYPFRILTILLVGPSPQVGMLRALEIEMVAHVFLAGVVTLWLARHLGMRGAAALLSATAYELGFVFISQTQHIGFVETAAWLPLVFLGVILLAEQATVRRFALLAATLALSLLAGFAPAALAVFAVAGIFSVLYALLSRSGFQVVLMTILAGTAAILLSAIQLIPTIELTALGIGHQRSTWRGTGGGLPLSLLKTLIRPDALGALSGNNPAYEITLSYLYCGIPVLALAVVALFVKPSRIKFTILIFTVISGFGIFGDNTPLGKAAFLMLPDFIRGPYYPTSWMPVFSLSIALLSGFGLQNFQFLGRWAYAIVLLCAADLIWTGSTRPMNTAEIDPASVVLDNAIFGEPVALAAMREATKAHFPPYRIDGKGDDAWASWTWLTRVPSANGFDPLSVERLLRLRLRLHGGRPWALSTIETVEPKVLSLMNVRYLMTLQPLTEDELSKSRFTLARTFPGRYLYENPNVLPRFFFVEEIVPSNGRDQSLELVNQETWEPRRIAVVEGVSSPRQALGNGTAQVVQYANQEVTLQVRSDADGFLASSETHYPGWEAYIDGVRVPIHYSNVAFRGIFVPGGEHQVVFKFRPASLMQGAAVTILSIVALCTALIWEGKRRRYQSGTDSFVSSGR
ncbi:MAG TPA: YfhO family protein [Terriglobia bacterium]|nr:YfhO family protein [Terriglobia bacterium]